MKDVESKAALLRKIEFWLATGIFLLSLLSFTANNVDTAIPGENPWMEFLKHVTVYASFLVMNFQVVPGLIRKQQIILNNFLAAVTFAAFFVVFKTIEVSFAAFSMFGIYTGLRYGIFFLLSHSDAIRAKYRFLAPGTLLLVVLWIISFSLLLLGEAEWNITILWATMMPIAIVLYSYSFYSLIPNALQKERPFLFFSGRVFLSQLIIAIPIFIIVSFTVTDEDDALAVSLLNGAFQLFVTMPATWLLYKRFMRNTEELSSLEKKLGQSSASLDFLRSQINPHFLFNALNTLYGTAIQEKAERTSDAIQKLGDMMRFMLHENLQERISLSRETEYLTNYIALQRLRTDPIQGISVEVKIPTETSNYSISPMLLIPFVENAFKHGISFREPSYISITMEIKNGTLFFDVSNSKHGRSDQDPEKDRSGVGLSNVRQRLAILYPDKHSLLIRDTAEEYFVHLSIILS